MCWWSTCTYNPIAVAVTHVLNISLFTGNQGIKLFSYAWGYYSTILVLANLARGKPAFQKDMGWGGLPARGVDGNRNGQWGGASCTHTNIHSQAWWAVDLGKESQISRVSISNRADCCCKFIFQILCYLPMKSLTVLVTTIDAQWEGMMDVGPAMYEPALLPPMPDHKGFKLQ